MASIAEILLARGEQQANQRRRQGEISGQMWQNLANIASQAGQNFQQQQANAPRLAMERMAVQDAQQRQQGQAVIDQAMTPYTPNGPQPEGEGPAPPQHPYLDDQTGLFDTSKLSDVLSAHGLAHLAPDLLKPVESINESITKHQKAEQDLNNSTAVMYGDLANGVLQLKQKTGIPIDQAMDLMAQPALATKRMRPEQYQQIKAQIASLPPEQQDAALTQYMDAASKLSGDETLAKDAIKMDRYGRTKATNVIPEPNKGDYTINGQRFKADGTPIGAVQPTQTAPKAYQKSSVLLDGKPAEILTDPTPGGKVYDLNGGVIENPASRVKPIPSQAAVNISQGESDAKAIADSIIAGQQPPDVKGLFRLAGPVRAELAKQGYDMTTANLDWEATKKHLATLNGAQQTRLRQSISTASDSLDVIQGLADKWDAGRFPILNKANLTLAKNGAYGKDAASIATQLEGQITDVTSELGNVYMGGNSPTDHALQLAGKNLNANWDRKVLTDMIALARKNLQIRGNSITNAGAVTMSNQVMPAAASPQGLPTVGSTFQGGKVLKVEKVQ